MKPFTVLDQMDALEACGYPDEWEWRWKQLRRLLNQAQASQDAAQPGAHPSDAQTADESKPAM